MSLRRVPNVRDIERGSLDAYVVRGDKSFLPILFYGAAHKHETLSVWKRAETIGRHGFTFTVSECASVPKYFALMMLGRVA